jgi:phosphoglycerate dehydrogenase-like enzyme
MVAGDSTSRLGLGPAKGQVETGGQNTVNSPRILVTMPLDDTSRAEIAALGQSDEVRFVIDPTDEDLEWATVVFGNVAASAILQASSPPLWIHSPNVGLDSYDEIRERRPEIRISHTTGILDAAVAEHAVGLLFALTRDLPAIFNAQRDRTWGQRAYIAKARATTLAGKSAHVLGYGSIARSLVTRLVGLGMRVTAYRRTASKGDDLVVGFERLDRLRESVSDADVVVSVLPSNAGTYHSIGEAELAAMKETAYLVNVGRGSTIDLDALISSLESNRLAGVALDVFEDEPLAASSPLWTMPRVIVSPHVAGRFDLEMRGQTAGFLDEYAEVYGLPRSATA